MNKSIVTKIAIFATVTLIALILFLVYAYNTEIGADRILQNVHVENVDIGGMTKDKAKITLEENHSYKNLKITYNNSSYEFDLKELGFEYNIEDVVEDAYNIGRSNNFLEDIGAYINQTFLGNVKDFKLDTVIPQNLEEEVYARIASDVETEPKNAGIYIGSGIEVKRGIEGIEIDRTKLKEEIYFKLAPNQDVNIDLPIKKVQPDITSDKLEMIDGIIGSYRTTFSANDKGRNHNIALSSSLINDTLIMPGEEFSYNKQTKLKTAANGYQIATVIVNGEIEEGLGGGVCQVSSTLYNSVLYSGLKVVQRRPHSIPSSYVPYGRDAVVSDNSIDFKFINNYDFPVYIKSYTDNNSVTVNIYGKKSSVPDIQISSQVVSKVERAVKYVEDDTIKKGEEVIKTKGRDEIRSETYVTVDGVKKLVSKDKYPAQTKVILVGTKTT